MPTALVTGASAGIGAAFAEALAARGSDLVLVARDTARLDQLAARLKSQHRIASEVLTADLTTDDGVGAVEARLREPVDLLVNNAGFGTVGKFAELPLDAELREIQLNVVALVRLCRAALEVMIERGSGGIINVASVAAFQPTPRNATYGATKAYVRSFSHSLHEEARGTGVRVTVLCPGFTKTEFQERAGIDSSGVPGFMWQSAEEVAEAGLQANDRNRAECVPGILNRVSASLSDAVPPSLSRRMAGLVIRRAEQ
jgi:short-subunit dehydrogenase